MLNATLRKLECIRCGHNWKPRKVNLPLTCPDCNSRYWNTPRKDDSVMNRGLKVEESALIPGRVQYSCIECLWKSLWMSEKEIMPTHECGE